VEEILEEKNTIKRKKLKEKVLYLRMIGGQTYRNGI